MKKLTVLQVEENLKGFDFSTVQKPTRNKGERGQLIEVTLGVENSSDLKDMIDGELKTFTIGETIAITQLNHCLSEIIENAVEFEESKVYQKLSQVIYIGFTRSNEYVGSATISEDTHSEHYLKLAEDYGYISSQIRVAYSEGKELNTITGPNNLLQIRTKASKNKFGEYTPLCYDGIQLKDKNMAFYLCSHFGKSLL